MPNELPLWLKKGREERKLFLNGPPSSEDSNLGQGERGTRLNNLRDSTHALYQGASPISEIVPLSASGQGRNDMRERGIFYNYRNSGHYPSSCLLFKTTTFGRLDFVTETYFE
jgi:hypothetical protein